MVKLLIAYKDPLILFLQNISRSFISFVIGLSIVYLLGRMLNILKTEISKNIIAFIVIFGSSYGYGKIYMDYTNTVREISDAILFGCGAIILYTTIGMRLWWHIEKLWESKLGKDNYSEKLNNKKKKKKRK